MLAKFIIATTIAFCSTALIAAQEPQEADQPSSVAEEGTQTLVGCLYEEEQVPGRSPNIAERAGVLEDYILVLDDTAAGTQAQAGETPEAAGTAGVRARYGSMFKVEHIDDDQLRGLVGKRVEVTGKIDAEESGADRPVATGGEADASLGPDEINLPEFEAASIREVEGECPAAPAPRE